MDHKQDEAVDNSAIYSQKSLFLLIRCQGEAGLGGHTAPTGKGCCGDCAYLVSQYLSISVLKIAMSVR